MTLNFMNVGCVVLKIHTEQNIVNETLYSTFNDCVTIQEFALLNFPYGVSFILETILIAIKLENSYLAILQKNSEIHK